LVRLNRSANKQREKRKRGKNTSSREQELKDYVRDSITKKEETAFSGRRKSHWKFNGKGKDEGKYRGLFSPGR